MFRMWRYLEHFIVFKVHHRFGLWKNLTNRSIFDEVMTVRNLAYLITLLQQMYIFDTIFSGG